MLFSKRYLTFKTKDEAQCGLQILRQYAIEHSKYLSANAFEKIVYERDTNYDPCIGWTLGMLDEARIFTEPGYYFYDEVSDEFINIDREIERLSALKDRIASANK